MESPFQPPVSTLPYLPCKPNSYSTFTFRFSHRYFAGSMTTSDSQKDNKDTIDAHADWTSILDPFDDEDLELLLWVSPAFAYLLVIVLMYSPSIAKLMQF